MTDVASAPAIDAPAAAKPINHWISGRRVAGESGRTSAVYNPAKGVQTGCSRPRHHRGGRPRSTGREDRIPRVALAVAC